MKTNLFLLLLVLIIIAFSATPALASPKHIIYQDKHTSFNSNSYYRPFSGGIKQSKSRRNYHRQYNPCPQVVHYYQGRPRYYSTPSYAQPRYPGLSNTNPNSIVINLGSWGRR